MTISDTNPMNPVKPFSGLKPTLVVLTSLVLLGLGDDYITLLPQGKKPGASPTDSATIFYPGKSVNRDRNPGGLPVPVLLIHRLQT